MAAANFFRRRSAFSACSARELRGAHLAVYQLDFTSMLPEVITGSALRATASRLGRLAAVFTLAIVFLAVLLVRGAG